MINRKRVVTLFLLAFLPCLAQTKPCQSDIGTNDERCTLEAGIYLGVAIDTFASGDALKYLNLVEAGVKKERAIAGFDVAYRVWGQKLTKKAGKFEVSKDKNAADNYLGRQLWVYVETVHGVRSADVDCTGNPDLPTCKASLNAAANVAKTGQHLYYILRNATSVEGFMGLRYEFLPLNPDSSTPANLYFKAQAGFLIVSGAPDSASDLHHFGLGAIATKGDFQGSYLEAGYGRSDILQFNRRRRFKVDGYLERRLGDSGVSFFAQMLVDPTSAGARTACRLTSGSVSTCAS